MDQIFTSEIEPKLEVQVSQRDQLGTGDIRRLNQSMQRVRKQLKIILNVIMKCYRKTMAAFLKKGSKFALKRKQTVKSSSNRQTSTQKTTQQEKTQPADKPQMMPQQSQQQVPIPVASSVQIQPQMVVMSGQQQPQGQQMHIQQQIQGAQTNQSTLGTLDAQSQAELMNEMNQLMESLITNIKSGKANQKTIISTLTSNKTLMAISLKQQQASSLSSHNQLFQQ
ncbi:negative elongation factor A-like [Panonychus citri]|uniref:negative elongation factor A-like n=1 Tax=Panonychus citri TaxID=50023 RepID=UPI0023080F1C|nr:negative elongation factor A-like [Panonychus citri]